MEVRKAFITAYGRQEQSFSALCRYFGVSRPTGYKWLERFHETGEEGLEDQSRVPVHQPRAMPAALRGPILELRAEHPTWGPKKLKARLERLHPQRAWPARSTIGQLLKREGLARPRPSRRRTLVHQEPLLHAQATNDVWCADFKGWFLCRNGQRCDPLTASDAYSRYLLRCRAVPKTDGPHVREIFEAAFREFGLPAAIRTDNGPPFASTGLAGLSRLSVWWIRLGIRPERIAPGCPEQNAVWPGAGQPRRDHGYQHRLQREHQNTPIQPDSEVGVKAPMFGQASACLNSREGIAVDKLFSLRYSSKVLIYQRFVGVERQWVTHLRRRIDRGA